MVNLDQYLFVVVIIVVVIMFLSKTDQKHRIAILFQIIQKSKTTRYLNHKKNNIILRHLTVSMVR